MKKLFYLLAFFMAFSVWSCSSDEEGGGANDPQFNLLTEARTTSGGVTGLQAFTYDSQGRVLTRTYNGQAAGSVSYSGSSMTVTEGGETGTIALDALGNASSFYGRSFTYFTTGATAGYIHTMTVNQNESAIDVISNRIVAGAQLVTFVVSDDGKYTSFTQTNVLNDGETSTSLPQTDGFNVITGTILYSGNLVNKSESFNPITKEFGMTFLGKGPAFLPTRINMSDGSHLTYTYTLYPSGHVKKMVIKYYDENSVLQYEEEFYGNWRSGGTDITGGIVFPGSVDARVTEYTEWAGSDQETIGVLTYNAQGKITNMLETRYGEDPQNMAITYPTSTTISLNGTPVGTLSAAGYVLTMMGETYTYNSGGYLTQKTELRNDGSVYQEIYTYNADHCVSSILTHVKPNVDAAWINEEIWQYEYETADGYLIPNVANCLDVAQYNWWSPLFGKVSPYLPVREIGPDDTYDIGYEFDENWFPTTITFTNVDTEQMDVVLIEWDVID